MTPDSEKIGIPLTAIRRERERKRNIREGGGVKFKGEDEFKGNLKGVTHTQQKILDMLQWLQVGITL